MKHLHFREGVPFFHRDFTIHTEVVEALGAFTSLAMVIDVDRLMNSIIEGCTCGKPDCTAGDVDYYAVVIRPSEVSGRVHVLPLAPLDRSQAAEFDEAYYEAAGWAFDADMTEDNPMWGKRWSVHAASAVGRNPHKFLKFIRESGLVDVSKLSVAVVGPEGIEYSPVASLAPGDGSVN
jgi:hypothetical protein